jgi:hypothetical protein
MDETLEEEELSQCPFSKREKKIFANNNEKISPVCLNFCLNKIFRYPF